MGRICRCCRTTEGSPVGRSRWLRGLVGLGLMELVLPLDGREVAEAGVQSAVVVAVEPSNDGPAGLSTG